jgi:hypothetical protein
LSRAMCVTSNESRNFESATHSLMPDTHNSHCRAVSTLMLGSRQASIRNGNRNRSGSMAAH